MCTICILVNMGLSVRSHEHDSVITEQSKNEVPGMGVGEVKQESEKISWERLESPPSCLPLMWTLLCLITALCPLPSIRY